MSYTNFLKGPIQLYALPGTEDYVQRVARWIARDILAELKAKKIELVDYFLMEEQEIEEYKYFEGSKEDFLSKFLVGNFSYFVHRNGAIEVSINSSARKRDIYVFHTFSEAQILDQYPHLKPEDLQAVFAFVRDCLKDEAFILDAKAEEGQPQP